MAASATFALKAGVWFRRGRLFIVSPDSLGTACPLSGRNSTYRPVQILEASSVPPAGGRDWDVLPILMVLEFGDRNGHAFGMPEGGKRGGAYAYAPERHHVVFLFGRLRRWTRDRGRDLAHLSRATAAT